MGSQSLANATAMSSGEYRYRLVEYVMSLWKKLGDTVLALHSYDEQHDFNWTTSRYDEPPRDPQSASEWSESSDTFAIFGGDMSEKVRILDQVAPDQARNLTHEALLKERRLALKRAQVPIDYRYFYTVVYGVIVVANILYSVRVLLTIAKVIDMTLPHDGRRNEVSSKLQHMF